MVTKYLSIIKINVLSALLTDIEDICINKNLFFRPIEVCTVDGSRNTVVRISMRPIHL